MENTITNHKTQTDGISGPQIGGPDPLESMPRCFESVLAVHGGPTPLLTHCMWVFIWAVTCISRRGRHEGFSGDLTTLCISVMQLKYSYLLTTETGFSNLDANHIVI